MNIVVEGNPKAQKRHRHRKNGHTYDPSKGDKVNIKKQLLGVKPAKPLTSPLRVELNFFIQTPKSWSDAKKKRFEGKYRPLRPDIDNYEKLVLDAMNGMIFKDDNQVVELVVRKFYSVKSSKQIEI